MPAPTYNLGGKTRRGEFEQAFLSDRLQSISYSRPNERLEWRGSTTDATPTEIFINGKGAITGVTDSAARLYVPETGRVFLTGSYVGVNQTDGTIFAAGTFNVAASRPNAGNVTLSTTASGTAVAPNVLGGNPSFNAVVGNVGAIPIAITANTTNQAIQIAVTGVAAKNIEWLVAMEPIFAITDRFSSTFPGDRGLGDGVEP